MLSAASYPVVLLGSLHTLAERVCAFGLYPVTNRRVPHISLVFREMWDTAGPPLKLVEGYKRVASGA